MAKRFTDTDKWKKPFIRGLDAPYKLLWFYILDDCNHAGIWEVDMEVASIRIGEAVNEDEAIEKFGGRVQKISSTKWFLADFIFFQYGELNEKNRLHLSVIQILNKYGIKDLRSPLEGVKDKVKEQYKDKDKVEEGGVGETFSNGNFLVVEMFNRYKKANPIYPGSVKKDYKPLYSIAVFLCEQGSLQGQPENNYDTILSIWDKVVEIIAADNFYKVKSLLTISNHIQEIIQIGRNGKSNGKAATGGAVSVRSAFSKIDAMPDIDRTPGAKN